MEEEGHPEDTALKLLERLPDLKLEGSGSLGCLFKGFLQGLLSRGSFHGAMRVLWRFWVFLGLGVGPECRRVFGFCAWSSGFGFGAQSVGGECFPGP